MKKQGMILIVDDTEMNRSLLADMLSEDYEILEQCRTGVTALERGGMHQHMQKPPQEVRAAQLPLPGTHCPERT